MMTKEKLAELKKLAEAATRGEWKWYSRWGGTSMAHPNGWPCPDDPEALGAMTADGKMLFWFGNTEQYYNTAGQEPMPGDIDYIAAASPDVFLALIADIESKDAILSKLPGIVCEVIRKDPAIVLGIISPIRSDQAKATQELTATLNIAIRAALAALARGEGDGNAVAEGT